MVPPDDPAAPPLPHPAPFKSPSSVGFLPEARWLICITSKGQVTIPQEIRERCGLLPHTSVQFREENGRVVIEKATPSPSPGEEAIQRLRQARVRTQLSTEQLLALTRGEDP